MSATNREQVPCSQRAWDPQPAACMHHAKPQTFLDNPAPSPQHSMRIRFEGQDCGVTIEAPYCVLLSVYTEFPFTGDKAYNMGYNSYPHCTRGSNYNLPH